MAPSCIEANVQSEQAASVYVVKLRLRQCGKVIVIKNDTETRLCTHSRLLSGVPSNTCYTQRKRKKLSVSEKKFNLLDCEAKEKER